jgi:endonuclease-3
VLSAGCRAQDGISATTSSLESVRTYGTLQILLLLMIDHRNVGIGVDVHVHRITNRLGWHKPPTKTPEGTRFVYLSYE